VTILWATVLRAEQQGCCRISQHLVQNTQQEKNETYTAQETYYIGRFISDSYYRVYVATLLQ